MRNSPIVSVIEVRVKPQFGQERVLVEESDYVVRRYGIDYFFGFSNDVVTVNYTAGLDGENIKMFKLMILRAATREMQNMHDDVVGVKDLNTRNVAPLETVESVVSLAVAIGIGLLGNYLRRWWLDRQGFYEVAVVTGNNTEEATRRFLDNADIARDGIYPGATS